MLETETPGRLPPARHHEKGNRLDFNHTSSAPSVEGWSSIGDVTRSIFPPMLAELDRQADADPEPTERFSPAWFAWQKRHHEREGLRTELREAAALTDNPEDPAPLSSEGLAAFLAWTQRQHDRRRFHSRRRRPR